MRNPYQHGSIVSRIKGSRHQDILPSSCYTNQTHLELPPYQQLFPLQKLHTVGFPPIKISSWHWYVAFGYCTRKQTKNFIGATNSTSSSSSCVYILWTKVLPLWLLHTLRPHPIYMDGHTPWTPQIRNKWGKEQIIKYEPV